MEISPTYYTGVVASDPLKVEDFRLDLDGFQSEWLWLQIPGLKRGFPWHSGYVCVSVAGSIKVFELSPQEYVSQLDSNSSLEVTVTGQTDDVEVSEVKTIALKLPPLNITVKPRLNVHETFNSLKISHWFVDVCTCIQLSGQPQVNCDMYVMVSFTNTMGFPLTGAKLAMEGAGLLETQVYNYR